MEETRWFVFTWLESITYPSILSISLLLFRPKYRCDFCVYNTMLIVRRLYVLLSIVCVVFFTIRYLILKRKFEAIYSTIKYITASRWKDLWGLFSIGDRKIPSSLEIGTRTSYPKRGILKGHTSAMYWRIF